MRGNRSAPDDLPRGITPRGKSYEIRYRGPVNEKHPRGDYRETAKTASEAKRILERRQREFANHKDNIRRFVGPDPQRVSFGELLDECLLDREDRERRGDFKSMRTFRAHAAHVREFFGSMKAVKVDRATVQAYIASRENAGRKPATINRELEVVGAAFALAIENEKIAFAPRIKKLPERNARQGTIPEETFAAVLAHVDEPATADFLRFFHRTAMRPGEIASLKWSNFDRKACEIRLAAEDAKIGEARVVPIEGELREVMNRRVAARRPGCDFIFHRDGRGITSDSVLKRWHKAREAAKVPHSIVYDLRRTAITNLRRAGVPETVIMRISGHKTRRVFDRYSIIGTDEMRDALRRAETYVSTLRTETSAQIDAEKRETVEFPQQN